MARSNRRVNERHEENQNETPPTYNIMSTHYICMHMTQCVCVCVCVRERERGLNATSYCSKVYMKKCVVTTVCTCHSALLLMSGTFTFSFTYHCRGAVDTKRAEKARRQEVNGCIVYAYGSDDEKASKTAANCHPL